MSSLGSQKAGSAAQSPAAPASPANANTVTITAPGQPAQTVTINGAPLPAQTVTSSVKGPGGTATTTITV